MKINKISSVKEEIKKFLTNKRLLSITFACISYIYLCFIKIVPIYNVFSWLLFVCIMFAYIKTDFTCKKHIKLKKEITLLTLFFSFLLLYGSLLYEFKLDREVSVLRILFSFKSLLSYCGIFTLIYFVLINLYPKLISYTIKYSDNKNKTKLVFFGCFIIFLICWLPYFLRCFPGTLSPDSFKELDIVVNNFKSINDHHPVIHILFIGITYNIGYRLFETPIAGVAIYSITQMIILACMFSSAIVFLYKRRVNKKVLLLIILYYALVPMHGFLSIVMWKDVVFSGLVLLLTMELVKIIEKEKNNTLTFKSLISFIVISILCIFYRNNAVYMYCILILFTLIMYKKHHKIFIISFGIVIGLYIFVKGPVFNWLEIKKTSSVEYIGIPLQQVGRMAYKNAEFTKKEKEIINKVIPLKVMSEVYNPVASDYIKFDKHYNNKNYDNNKLDYLKLWLQLILKHPSIAIESYSISTLGYWYPGVEYWSIVEGIDDNKFGIETKNKSDKIITYYVDNIDSKNIPIVCIEWSIALCYWIILIFAFVTKRLKNKKSLYVFIPVFGIWITMLIASPVFGEFRYVYGAFTTLPLLMVYPYLKIK